VSAVPFRRLVSRATEHEQHIIETNRPLFEIWCSSVRTRCEIERTICDKNEIPAGETGQPTAWYCGIVATKVKKIHCVLRDRAAFNRQSAFECTERA